jgi:hypothetical protein
MLISVSAWGDTVLFYSGYVLCVNLPGGIELWAHCHHLRNSLTDRSFREKLQILWED